MPVRVIKVNLPGATNLPKDVYQNQFVVGGSSSTPADWTTVATQIMNFYNISVSGTTEAVCESISTAVLRTVDAITIKQYDITAHLDGSPHGSPVQVSTHTLGAADAGAIQLPSEVCGVLTFEGWDRALRPVEAPDDEDADTGVERPRQRSTGRISVGPLNSNAIVNATGGARLADAFIDTVLEAGQRLAQNIIDNTDDLQLMVWSRVDEGIKTVSHLSMDDAPDTQRRRGHAPSFRNRVTVPGSTP